MLRKLALMMALSPAMWLSTAFALGLGEIDVNSALNQRFSASIPLTDLAPDEADTLQVELAQSEAFDRAGLDRSDYLSTLSFVVKTDDGAPRIVISSRQIAREPYFNLLLEVRSRSGRIQRQFTILLDPPDYALNKRAPVTAPAADVPATAAPAQAPVAQKKTPVANAPSGSPARAEYGPVAAGETLWSIAARLRETPDITMDQMQLALYKSNPQAFENGHITKMLKGAMLKVPSEKFIKSVSPETAKSRIQQLRTGKSKSDTPPRPTPKKPDVSQPADDAGATGPAAAAPVSPPPKALPAPSSVPPAPAAAPAVKPTQPPASKTIAPSPTAAAATSAPAAAPKAEGPAAVPAKPDSVASAVTAVTPAASAVVVASTPASAVAATAPATVVGRLPLISETASASVTTAASAETAASGVTSQGVSSVQAQAVEPVKPYIPPPVPSAPEPSPLIEELEGPIKLAGGVLVIAGLLGGLLYSRRRAASKPAQKTTPKMGADKGFNWQFWKKKGVSATSSPSKKQTAPVVAPPPAAFDEEQFERDYEATQQSTQRPSDSKFSPEPQKAAPAPLPDVDHLPNFDSTQMFDAPHDAPLPAINPDAVDFDVTGRFEADTLKIDLNNNDPLAEADFHLAYGLFDEAALQLKQAAQKEPTRTDIPAKLAEVYFRAGKAADFQIVAETLKPKLSPAEWTKIALMGKQLSPDAPLYQGIDASAVVTDVDMAFDEPASPQAPQAAVPATAVDLELSSREAPKSDVAKPAADAGNMLEFNLDDFKFDAPDAKPAEKSEPLAAADDKAEAPLEFDLSSFDMGSADAGTPEARLPNVDEIKLDDFDLSMPEDSNAISTGDEASTKLDLARAYVDMGDNDMARSLLNEVLQQGSAGQKSEAQALLGRLA